MTDIDPGLKRYLASLDEAPLPEGLWERVDRARRYRGRRLLAAVAASAASVALALVLVLPGGAPGAQSAPEVAGAAGEDPPHATAGDESDHIRTLRAIDRALQVAYDRNATDDEIAPLWRARQHLVDTVLPPAQKKG